MIILSDIGYLLRSELLSQFLGLFRLSELVNVILRTLIRKSVANLCSGYVMSVYALIFMIVLRCTLESCLISTGSGNSLCIMFRSGAELRNTFAEPVRFGPLA